MVSLDLGLTETSIGLSDDGITTHDGRRISWPTLERIARSETKCFVVRDGMVEEIRAFSEKTNRVCSLFPTAGAPTMLVAGFTMHRIKGTDPRADTLEKIGALGRIEGAVLDTATGLGYTAIEAAKWAESVTTIELDPAVVEIARLNPWSRELFENPRITRLQGDSSEVVETLPDARFSAIIHDPPVLSLAGELYSSDFYRQLHRALRDRGRLFHYIGDPKSGSGAATTRGVVRRLREAGFSRVVPKPAAYGVLAVK
jgi:predicted methyltransferase